MRGITSDGAGVIQARGGYNEAQQGAAGRWRDPHVSSPPAGIAPLTAGVPILLESHEG